jgi:hypothetical protein
MYSLHSVNDDNSIATAYKGRYVPIKQKQWDEKIKNSIYILKLS